MSDAYTQADYETMRGQPLQRKIGITTTRLIEWHKTYDGQIYFVFDGTPESRVLVDLACRMYSSGIVGYEDVPHVVHVHTGSEVSAMDKYITSEIEKLSVVSIEYIEPEARHDEIVSKYGMPVVSRDVSTTIAAAQRCAAWALRDLVTGKFKRYKGLLDLDIKFSPYCCEALKEHPYRQYEARTGRVPVWPTLANNSESKQVWMSLGCNSTDTHESRPMSFWTQDDVKEYANAAKLTLPDFPTGCARCMFGKSTDFYRKLSESPELWEECVVNTGIDRVLDSIGLDRFE